MKNVQKLNHLCNRLIYVLDLPRTPIVATGVAIGPFGSNSSIRSSKNSANGESSSSTSSQFLPDQPGRHTQLYYHDLTFGAGLS